MRGYQITFFTQQDRHHRGKPLSEWLLLAARDLGLRGGTIMAGSEGYGAHKRLHAARFFELADQPQEVVMVVTEDEAEQLFTLLEEEGVHLFYVKTAAEFGTLGAP